MKRELGAGFASQFVSSGTNFLFSLYLIKISSPAEFGAWSIYYALTLFVGAILQGAFLIELAVTSHNLAKNSKIEYHEEILSSTVALSFLLAASVATIGYILEFTNGLEVFAIIAMTSLYCMKETLIRISFTNGRPATALAANISLSVTLIIGCAVTHLKLKTSGTLTALNLFAFSHVVAVLTAMFANGIGFKHPISRRVFIRIFNIFGEGRWNTLNAIVYALKNNIQTIFVATVLGTSATGILNATRLFVTPAIIAIPPLSQLFLPRIAQTATKGGNKAAIRLGIKLGLSILSGVIIYSLVLLFGFKTIAPIILPSGYLEHTNLVILWLCFGATITARNVLEWIHQALTSYKNVFISNMAATVIAVLIIGSLIYPLQISGAIIGAIFAELIGAIILAIKLKAVKGV